jgi:hypothetical protein
MRRRHVLPIAGLTLLGAILRFATLDLQSFGHDEAVTVFEVLQPGLADTVTAVVEDKEKSPPLYYVLAWAWTAVFGLGEIGVRSLSALLGTLTIPVAYLAGHELASRRAGLVAAALVALNPYLIWFSQEARAYSLFILLSTLTLLFLARAIRRGGGRDLALWALCAAASFATHYFTAFLIVPEALYLLYRLRSGRALAAVAVAAAGAAAVAPIALIQNSGRPGILADTSLAERVLRTVTSFSSGDQLALLTAASGVQLLSAVVGLAAAALAGVGIRLAFARGQARERRGALLAGALGSLAFLIPVVAALAGADLVNPRSMVVAVTPLLIAAAIGFGAQRSGRLGAGVGAALCVLFLVNLTVLLLSPTLQRRDYRGVAEAIGPPEPRRVVVAPQRGAPPLRGYLDGDVEGVEASNGDGRGRRAAAGTVADELAIVVASPAGSLADSLKPPPGFELAERETVGEFQVLMLRSPRPRRLDPSGLAPTRLVGPNPVVLAQQRRAG